MKNLESNVVEVEIDLDDLASGSHEEMVAALCTCHCQACGIKLDLQNSLNGRECIMCAIPMANIQDDKNPGIISTHW